MNAARKEIATIQDAIKACQTVGAVYHLQQACEAVILMNFGRSTLDELRARARESGKTFTTREDLFDLCRTVQGELEAAEEAAEE